MLKLKECPMCGSKRLRRATGPVKDFVNRKEITVPRATYWFCPDCQEEVYSLEDMRKIREYREGRKKIAA